jgi:exopolysaccharide production protein ExoY
MAASSGWGLDATNRGDVGHLGDGGVAPSTVAPPPAPADPEASAPTCPPAHVDQARSVDQAPATRPARSRSKRALDLGLGLITVPLTLTIGLVCALLIKLTSRGPVLFRQERVGLGGRTFTMYKFRTMYVEAEQLLHGDPRLWQEYVDNGFKVPAKLDPRVTRVGRLLRRSSLDELPQLLNVMGGSMSLVGPRPVVPDEVDNYGDRRSVYLSVRPGITGAWQINGRSTIDYPDRVDLDAEYVRSWSLWLDVSILARTPLAVLSARGAH